MEKIEIAIRAEIMKGKILEATLRFRDEITKIVKTFKEETDGKDKKQKDTDSNPYS